MVQQSGVHLAVTVDLHYDVHVVSNGRLVRSDDCTTDAEVLRVVEHPHSWVAVVLLNETAAAVGAGVIDRIDRFDLGADSGNNTQYVLSDLVARDGDGNAHRLAPQLVEASATPAMISTPPASVRQCSGSPRKTQASVGTMRKAKPMKG